MITLSVPLCTSLHVGHARRRRLAIYYRITVPGSSDLIQEAIIRLNTKSAKFVILQLGFGSKSKLWREVVKVDGFSFGIQEMGF